ncbi:MAG: cation diffusion facilitator family transporter [Aquificota bacterium]
MTQQEAFIDREKLVKEKKKIALLSVLLNLFLSLMKITVGIIAGSASLVADGIHSLADLAAAISVYAGIVIANMKNKDFPYGLYKVENLISLVSAFAIFFAGYEIVREVFFEDKVPHIKNLPLALGAVFLTIVATFLFSRWERKKGEELNSPSLIADAEHIKTDMLSSIIVLVGILGNYFGFPWVEKLAVLIIVALIFHAGWEIMVEALKVLLDATVDRETLQEVKEIMNAHPLVEKVKSLTGRSSGSYKFLEAEIVLKTLDLEKAHKIVHQLEEEIKRKVPFIERIIIHFEPPEEKKETKFALLLDENLKPCKGLENCQKVVIYKVANSSLEKIEELNLPKEEGINRGACATLIENLAQKKVDCLVVGDIFFGKGALYILAYYNIGLAVVPYPAANPEQILEKAQTNCKPAEWFLKR